MTRLPVSATAPRHNVTQAVMLVLGFQGSKVSSSHSLKGKFSSSTSALIQNSLVPKYPWISSTTTSMLSIRATVALD